MTIDRSNAFEVSSMDGGASVVLYSENKVELLSWYSAIKDRVVMLLEQSVSFFFGSLGRALVVVAIVERWPL